MLHYVTLCYIMLHYVTLVCLLPASNETTLIFSDTAGNEGCWDPVHTFERCCGVEEEMQPFGVSILIPALSNRALCTGKV